MKLMEWRLYRSRRWRWRWRDPRSRFLFLLPLLFFAFLFISLDVKRPWMLRTGGRVVDGRWCGDMMRNEWRRRRRRKRRSKTRRRIWIWVSWLGFGPQG